MTRQPSPLAFRIAAMFAVTTSMFGTLPVITFRNTMLDEVHSIVCASGDVFLAQKRAIEESDHLELITASHAVVMRRTIAEERADAESLRDEPVSLA